MKRSRLLFTLGVPAVAAGCTGQTQTQQPNVIIILADDLGFGDIGCNGATGISTPGIDSLASSGIRFTNAHSTAAMSTPSRYSMLTGEYAFRREGTGIAAGNAAMIIRPDRYTLADMFQRRGYATGVVGKWHLGLGDVTGEQDWNGHITPGPSDIGFGYSFIMAATGDRVPCVYVENEHIVNLDPNDPVEVSYTDPFPGEPTGKNNPGLLKMHPSHGHDMAIVNGISRIGYMKGGKSALWEDETINDVITAKALSFIEDNAKKPFFLYFATNDIHVPRVPHPRFAGKSGMGPRGDAILEFDWTVGEIVNAVKKAGIEKNTIIILSSDNGPVVDDGYRDQAWELLGDHTPAGPYRGGKYSAFDGGTKVPCLLSWPGQVEPGVSDALLCQTDWFASLASLIGVDIPKGAAPDSENLLPAWLGKEPAGRQFLVVENATKTLSLITPDWKYIPGNDQSKVEYYTKMELGNDKNPQLYHLKVDPGEKYNYAPIYPAIADSLAIKLTEIINK